MSMDTDLPTPRRIYLIRHGETEWSLTGRHTGRTDIPLTARGENGARKLAPRLREIQFSRVLTSPSQRAQRTRELTEVGPADEIEPDLAEWDYGSYEGQRSVDICKNRADWNIFRDGCPLGETPAEVSDRADRLITRLRALGGNIALFTHGQFGSVLAARWIGLLLVEAQHFALSTASISVLGYAPHHADIAVILSWNATVFDLGDTGSNRLAGDARSLKERGMELWED